VLVERTRAGLAIARREGKRLGRPRTTPLKVERALQFVQGGLSLRQAAKQAGVAREVVRQAVLGA
jgi:DNA invertase Pin-like site-specific DNA recombinase